MSEEFVDVALTCGGILGLLVGFLVPPVGLFGAIFGTLGLALAVWERIIKPTQNTSAHEVPPPSEEKKLANAIIFFGKGVFVLLLVAWVPVFAVWASERFFR